MNNNIMASKANWKGGGGLDFPEILTTKQKKKSISYDSDTYVIKSYVL